MQGLRRQFPDTLDFYRWLEWIADEQLGAAQQAAKDAGMQIGLMADMAVGVHPSGSDVWWNPERFAKGATVGAPPDIFNQQGQDWSQPPLNPIELENTGYRRTAYGAGHVRPCRRGAHRPHPRSVPPVVDPLRAHAQGRRLCAVRFRDHARHPGT